MHVIDIFAAFYIREKIVSTNIAEIKRPKIKDGLCILDKNIWPQILIKCMINILLVILFLC